MRKPRGRERRQAEAAVPVAKDALHDHHGVVVGRRPPDALDGNGQVDRRHVVVPDTHFRPDERRLRVREPTEGDWVGGGGELGEVFVGELDELAVVDTASTDQHHSVSCVVGADV